VDIPQLPHAMYHVLEVPDDHDCYIAIVFSPKTGYRHKDDSMIFYNKDGQVVQSAP